MYQFTTVQNNRTNGKKMTELWGRKLSCFGRRRVFTAELVNKINPISTDYGNPVLTSGPKDDDMSKHLRLQILRGRRYLVMQACIEIYRVLAKYPGYFRKFGKIFRDSSKHPHSSDLLHLIHHRDTPENSKEQGGADWYGGNENRY